MGPRPLPSSLCRVLLAAGAAAWGVAQARADADWSGLIAKSPFGQSAGTVAGQPEPTELEFRGLVVEGSARLVNLYDPATKTARWVEEHATVNGLQVLAYDAPTNQVKVARDGRVLTLPLKQARVALLQPAPAARPKESAEGTDAATREERRAEFRAQMRARFENGGPPPHPLSPEAEAVVQEIRRRRALRDGTPPPAAPAVSAPPGTAAEPPPPPEPP